MKKLFITFLFTFLILPLHAQEEISTKLLTHANLKKEVQLLFKRSDIGKQKVAYNKLTKQLQDNLAAQNFNSKKFNTSNPNLSEQLNALFSSSSNHTQQTNRSQGNAEHPWQLLIFLADRDRPLAETLNQIRSRIKQGTLTQASVLVTPRVYRQDPLKVEQMYFIYDDGEKPVTEHFNVDHLADTEELLDMLASHLEEDENNLYTGVIVDAHGNGVHMKYKQHQQQEYFSVPDLLKPFHKKQLKLDLLVLDSCEMSSFFSLYYLTENDMVDYLVASSDIMYVTSDVMYYHVLRFLDYQPRDAAVRSVRYRPNFLHFNPSYETTNAGVIDLKNLREPLQQWANEYYAISNKMPEINAAFKKWFTKEDTLRSLSRTVIRQKKYLEEHFDQIGVMESYWIDCHNEEMKNAFIQASDVLLESLKESTLTQWCYSPRADQLYWDNIPNNDCMESVSVNKEQLAQILEENEDSFDDYQRKYICRLFI